MPSRKQHNVGVTKFVVRPASPKGGVYRTVSSLSNRSGYSTGHIRKLLRSGKVSGVKVGNTWLATVRTVKRHATSTKNGRPLSR